MVGFSGCENRLFVSLAKVMQHSSFDPKASQLRRLFRRHAKSRQESVKTKKLSNAEFDAPSAAGVGGGGATNAAAVPWSTLVRPAVFTVAFGCGSFAAASIWQYENMREEARSIQGRFRRQLRNGRKRAEEVWEEFLSGNSDGADVEWRLRDWGKRFFGHNSPDSAKVFASILAANLLVFCLWKAPSLQPAMLRYFSSNPASSKNVAPMLLSAFSHYSALHLAANMFVLHSLCHHMVSTLGKEQFVALYLSSAVLASFTSMAAKVAFGTAGYSLGASGSICCVLGAFATLVPDARMQLIFLPGFTFTSASAIKGLIAFDTMGLVARWKFMDHAAHLGGVMMGIWYCSYGHGLVWDNRKHLMTWWHKHVRGEK